MKNLLIKIGSALTSDKFKNFIAQKCLNEVKLIAQQNLSTIDNQEDADASEYMGHMNVLIDGNDIIIYNDSTIDTSTRSISEEKRSNYPLKLSLAKIVEFGIGYTGEANTKVKDSDWEYDVNDHGYKGWYYQNNGQTFWTNGFEGRLVFYELKNVVSKKIGSWLKEYIDNEIED